MKKIIEGIFARIYYNDCEAGCPLGLLPKGVEDKTDPDHIWLTSRENLCDLFKEALLPWAEHENEQHSLIGKKVKITIEVEE